MVKMSIFMDILILGAFACAMSIPFFFVYNKMVKSKYSNADLNLSKQSFFQKHDVMLLNTLSLILNLIVFYFVLNLSGYYEYDPYYLFYRFFYYHIVAGFMQIVTSVLMAVKLKHKYANNPEKQKKITGICVAMCIASAVHIIFAWWFDFYEILISEVIPIAVKIIIFTVLSVNYNELVKNNSESEATQPEQKTVNKVQYIISGDEPVRKNSTKVQYRISDGEDKS